MQRLARSKLGSLGLALALSRCEFCDARLPPFDLVKPHRVGISLFLGRRIVQPHGGRLWASPNPGPCVVLQFTPPG